MLDGYKTILATCMRLKGHTLKDVSLLTSNALCYAHPMVVSQTIQPLLNEVKCLIDTLPNQFDNQKQFLVSDSASCKSWSDINHLTYSLGSLVRDIDNLDAIVNSQGSMPKNKVAGNEEACKKIFISHSSKDKMIVDAFVTLLTRGAGIAQGDIFCTSIDGMKITNGEEIRKHIQANVNYADFAILLASKNYKESEICLNEMGAVWAMDKKVKAYVFPDLQEESVGWLINNKASEKLNNQTALASLYEELQQFYGLPLSISGWTAQAKVFCDNFK